MSTVGYMVLVGVGVCTLWIPPVAVLMLCMRVGINVEIKFVIVCMN